MTKKRNHVNNKQDMIDSLDVIARIDELQYTEDPAEVKELDVLEKLASETARWDRNWQYGSTLIRYDYFREYAKNLAEDSYGDTLRNASWPYTCIDWTAAAEELQGGYTEVLFDGVPYFTYSS